jgi:ATP-binding cassette subfamily B protein
MRARQQSLSGRWESSCPSIAATGKIISDGERGGLKVTEQVADPRLGWGALSPSGCRVLVRERWRMLCLLGAAGRWVVGGLVAASVLSVAAGTLMAPATGWLVTAAAGRDLATVWPPLLAVVGLVVLGQVGEQVYAVCAVLGVRRADGAVRTQVRGIALAPAGIGHLDDADFRDDVERACDLGLGWRTRSPGAAGVGQLVLMFRFAGAGAAALVLGWRFPLLACGLLAASMTMRVLVRRQWMWLVAVEDSRQDARRRSQYFGRLAVEAGPAKDVRMFGLADWLIGRMSDAATEAWTPAWQARGQVLRKQGISWILAGGSAAAAILVLGTSGQSAGLIARCLTAAFVVMGLSVMGTEAFDIDYGVSTVQALDRLLERPTPPPVRPEASGSADASPNAVTPPSAVTPQSADASLVCFEDVSFTYPGARHPTIDGLTLTIHPGETLAVVGVNGAGKTTMTKLLAGLYAPTSGRITVDGADLATLDPDAWRRRMTALFQDFVHYGTTVADNVALSAPEDLADMPGINAALAAAGAEDLVSGLPDGAETTLWRGGAGAVDLSGGQWQKLAIARALFAVAHGRRLLILDEPTAHLDVEAEQEFNQRVTAHAAGASTVIISHRLSNVRGADRIVVLDGGRVTEVGSHDALVALDGAYARLFRLQAARFEEVPS